MYTNNTQRLRKQILLLLHVYNYVFMYIQLHVLYVHNVHVYDYCIYSVHVHVYILYINVHTCTCMYIQCTCTCTCTQFGLQHLVVAGYSYWVRDPVYPVYQVSHCLSVPESGAVLVSESWTWISLRAAELCS